MNYRNWILPVTIGLMLAGLFFSRFLLSASMILFIVASFQFNNPVNQLKSFFNQPILVGISLLFLLPFISGLWSQDIDTWVSVIRIKLPLLLLPLAFASNYFIHKKNWVTLSVILILLTAGATWWSMWHYLVDMDAVHSGYLQAKTMVTPLQNDHVRFSWMVSAGILLAAYLVWQKNKLPLQVKAAWIILIIWLIVYLHILAARTGLICFYAMCFIGIMYFIFKKQNIKRSIVALLFLVAIPVLAYFVFPTFQKRVQYNLYDLSVYNKQVYMPGSNDGMRLISIRAGWQVMNNAPFTGVGFGDIHAKTVEWYDHHYPEMIPDDKIYPSSEWMMYGGGTGWIGLFIFLVAMATPFFISPLNQSPVWLMLNVSAALSFLFDIGLEVQYGVFLYSFFVLWFYKGIHLHKKYDATSKTA